MEDMGRSDLPFFIKRREVRFRDGANTFAQVPAYPRFKNLLGFGREILFVDDSRGPKARANGMHEGDMTVDTTKMLDDDPDRNSPRPIRPSSVFPLWPVG